MLVGEGVSIMSLRCSISLVSILMRCALHCQWQVYHRYVRWKLLRQFQRLDVPELYSQKRADKHGSLDPTLTNLLIHSLTFSHT